MSDQEPQTATPKRTCRVCGFVAPATTEFFVSDSRSLYGVKAFCRDCARSESANRRLARTTSQVEVERESARKRSRLRRLTDPDSVRAIQKKWYDKNPDKVRAFSQSAIERRRVDPKRNLDHRIRSRMREFLSGRDSSKSWIDKVGYTLDELYLHLERQFTVGMTWENMGEWHVDHIIPLSSFSYSDHNSPEFKAAWSLTNLRPIWATENLQKRSKVLHLL